MKRLFGLAALLLAVTLTQPGFAKTGSDKDAKDAHARAQRSENPGRLSVGIGIKSSTLGIGAEAALPAGPHANVRVGANMFSFSRGLTNSGIRYDGTLRLRSVETLLDLFPFGRGGFHISPGALLYNGNQVTATASVPGGQIFTLGGVDYMSNPANPIHGTGSFNLRKAAPMVMLGFGNLIPRSRHFSVTSEWGVVFQGSPNSTLNLAGSACDVTGLVCLDAATDPTIQSNVQAQQTKINNDLTAFKYYPVFSFGFGYKF